MAVPNLEQPQVAENLAQFDPAPPAGPNRAATISYDVPLPGGYSWRRSVPLEVDAAWFEAGSADLGDDPDTIGIETDAAGGVQRINANRLADAYQGFLPDSAIIGDRIVTDTAPESPAPALPQPGGGRLLTTQNALRLKQQRREEFIQSLVDQQAASTQASRGVAIPTAGIGQSVQTVAYDPSTAGVPRIALLESWELRSFRGDYGLGATLKTCSLLPGERSTISIETWRTEASSRVEGSSIFDSSDAAAQTRFNESLSKQTGSAFQDQGGWAVSLGTKASASGKFFDVVDGSASVEVGFAANHQEARQTFATSVSQSAQEHAAQVNTSRQQAVEQSSTAERTSGEITTTVREISNTNLRRVLNFVFRELDQTHETYVLLRDVKVGFFNGRPNSAEIVPLSALRKLLSKHIVAARREEVARMILSMVAECIDYEGNPVTTLQIGTRPNGRTYAWADIGFKADGSLNFDQNPLDGAYSWRFKPGKLGNGNDRAPGVITSKDELVLRTDSVVVEALLGKADALDPYASALQALDLRAREADILWRESETKKTVEALELVEGVDEDEKVDAFEKLLGEKAEIEVVPVAAAVNGR